ncbi:hypothetical protein [Staphylospora marina]|uniref:hypothetical protein n=1 Tax=Staphylospora marina TaxID=2490858 RepID=UPI000F5BC004|nr:hypothetical protein [Staphylospora marina]
MRPHTFQIPYSVVERLTPKERFVYYELCRLGSPVDTVDETFKIPVPKGAFITSHYRMSKELDMAYSLTALLIEGLAEKGLIEWSPIEHEEFRSYYLVRVKQVLPDDDGIPSFRHIRRNL